MPSLIFILLALLAGPVSAEPPAAAAETLQDGLVNPGFHEQPAWFKQSFLDVREDIAEAAKGGKRLMLYFYQDGCPYCKKLLETNFSQRDIVQRTRKGFDVVSVNMWGDRDVVDLNGNNTTEKQFAADQKVMFTPTLLMLNEQGQIVMRLNGYYPPHKFGAVVDYVGQHQENKLSFQAYWAGLNPVASTGKLHRDESYLKAPFHLAGRPGDKPLMVLFEQKDCAACDELHDDILKRKESIALMKRFDVVLLDMWSNTPVQTPDGTTMKASDWSKALNIQYAPTMVMFDSTGKEAFRAEAYLKAFHTQSAMDYVLSGAYLKQPSFQRYIAGRADELEARGVHVDIMD